MLQSNDISWDDVTPEMIVRDLKSVDVSTQLRGVRLARRLLRAEEPALTRVVAAGVIAPLVDALDRGDCPSFQYRALGVLNNVAFASCEHTVTVANSGPIPKLISFLAHDNDLAERAIHSLGNFPLHGPAARDAVLACGAVRAMLPHMTPDTPYWRLRTYVRAYSNFCSNVEDEPLVKLELVSPALPCLAALLLDTGEPDILVDACTALTNIMYGPDEYIEAVQATPGLTTRLVGLLRHEAAAVRRAALGAVGNMLAGTDTQVDRCLDANCLDHIESLLQSGSPSLVSAAARATGNILAGTHEQIQQALDKHILFHLRKILIEGNPECQQQAMFAVTCLCVSGAATQRTQLMSRGVLQQCCMLLATEDRLVAEAALHALYELIEAAERDGSVKPLCYLLDDLDVVDQLVLLQEDETDENRSIISDMCAIIRRHAREERSVVQDGKTFTAVDIVQDLQASDVETYRRAARAACDMLSLEHAPVHAMLEAGIMPRLLEALDSGSFLRVSFATVWALFISAGSRRHRMAVVHSGTIPKLVALLTHGDQLAETAASCLGNMALHGPEARRAVLAYTCSDEALAGLRTYTFTYRNYCRQVGGQPLSNLSRVLPALPFIADLLEIGDQIILEDACWAFANLTKGGVEVIETLQTVPRLTERLVALLGHEAAAIKKPALEAVGNMLIRNRFQFDRCLDAGCVDHIVSILRSAEPALVQAAARTAVSLLRSSPAHIQLCLDKKMLPELRNLLVNGDTECRVQAGRAITCLCRNGSATQRAVVASRGVLRPYCALLASATAYHDLMLADCVLNGLHNLRETAQKEGKLKDFCMKLDEIGVLDQLRRLLELELDQANHTNAVAMSFVLRQQARGEHVVIYQGNLFTLVDIMQGLNTQDLATQAKAASAASRMLRSLDSSTAAMVEAGVVAPLVAALDNDNCTDLQHPAIQALDYITRNKREHVMAVIRCGAIPKLIELLKRGVGLPEIACVILGNIVNKELDAQDFILEQGALQAVLPYMRPDTNPSKLKIIMQSCHMLCRFQINFEVVAPVVPCILDLLYHEDEDILEIACRIVQTILDGPDERVETIQAVPGLAARLVALMSHEAATVQDAALGAVGNMLNGTDRQKQKVMEMDVLTPLMRMLDDPANYNIKYYTTCTLNNICTSKRREHIVAVVENEAVPKLIALLSHEDLVVIVVAGTLANIALHGPDLRDIVLAYGAVPAMRPHMRPDRPVELLRACVLACSCFCKHDDPMVELDLIYPALPYIYKLLRIKDQCVLEYACSAFAELMLTVERIEAVQAMPGLTVRLVGLLGHDKAGVKEAALAAVTKILAGAIIQVERCLDAGCFQHIIHLLDCGDPCLVIKAIMATDMIASAIQRDLVASIRHDGEQTCLVMRRNAHPIPARAVSQNCKIRTTYSSGLYNKTDTKLVKVPSELRDHSKTIVNSEVIAKLVQLLACGGQITVAAATALGNIANHGNEARDTVRAHGAVEAMLPHLRLNTPLNQLTIYVQSFYGLIRYSMVELDLVAPALPYITELLYSEDPIILENVCLILVNLMFGSDEVIREAVRALPGVTERVVALLGHAATDVKTAALCFVVNALAENSTQSDCCLEDECLEHIVSLLQSSEPSLVEYATQATSNIFTKTQPNIQLALDKGILTPLAKILADGQLECTQPAAMAILNLCCNGTAAQLEQLAWSGALQPSCELLAAPDVILVNLVLEALLILLMFAVEEGKLSYLSMKYREYGVLHQIKTLQKSEIGNDIRRRAIALNDMMLSVNDPDSSQEKKNITPAGIMQELQSQDLGIRVRAARAARRFISSVDKSRTDLVETGVILLIVTGLDCSYCADLQYEAVRKLSSVTAEVPHHLMAAVDSGVIPKLITLLPYGGKVAGFVLWTLGNICCRTPGLRDQVLGQGAVRALRPLLRPDTPLALLRTCVWAVETFCCHDEESSEKLKSVSPLLPQLSDVMNAVNDTYILEQACWALKLLVETVKGIEAVQATPGLTTRLVWLLGHEGAEVKRAALNVVLLMFTGTEAQAERCLSAGCVEQLLALLQSSEHRLLALALQAISNMLRSSIAHQAVNHTSLLARLLTIMSDSEPNSSFQMYAVSALANFTAGERKEPKMAVVKNGGIPKLVSLLSLQADVATAAAATLANIASARRKTRDIVLYRGAARAMLPRLTPDAPLELLRTFMWAYWQFCRSDDDQRAVKLELVSPALPHMSELLAVEDQYVLNCACEVLCCLLKTSEGIDAVQATPGLTTRLVGLLGHEEAAVKEAASKGVLRMLSGTDSQVDHCLAADCVEHVISYLECRDPALVERAERAARDTLGAEHPWLQRALDQDSLTPLMTTLACNSEGRVRTVRAVCNLHRRAAAAQRALLVSRGVLQPCCALLATEVQTVTRAVLDALHELLQVEVNDGNLEQFCQQLIEMGVLDQLTLLREHEDEQVNEKARRLLNTYFTEE